MNRVQTSVYDLSYFDGPVNYVSEEDWIAVTDAVERYSEPIDDESRKHRELITVVEGLCKLVKTLHKKIDTTKKLINTVSNELK